LVRRSRNRKMRFRGGGHSGRWDNCVACRNRGRRIWVKDALVDWCHNRVGGTQLAYFRGHRAVPIQGSVDRSVRRCRGRARLPTSQDRGKCAATPPGKAAAQSGVDVTRIPPRNLCRSAVRRRGRNSRLRCRPQRPILHRHLGGHRRARRAGVDWRTHSARRRFERRVPAMASGPQTCLWISTLNYGGPPMLPLVGPGPKRAAKSRRRSRFQG